MGTGNRTIHSQAQRGGFIRRESWEQLGCVWAYGGWACVWGLRRCGFPGGSCMLQIMGWAATLIDDGSRLVDLQVADLQCCSSLELPYRDGVFVVIKPKKE